MKIEWKDIKDFEGLYKVSNLGNIYSFYSKRLLNPYLDKNGYCVVCLRKDNKNNAKKVHRLVAQAFIDNIENKPAIDHINGIKTDNNVSNLRFESSIIAKQQLNIDDSSIRKCCNGKRKTAGGYHWQEIGG